VHNQDVGEDVALDMNNLVDDQYEDLLELK
jgi:hypothetical protein